MSTDYGREVIVFLCNKDRDKGKFSSVQHIIHMPIVGDFAGRKNGHNYFIVSIHDVNGVTDVVCGQKLSWKKVAAHSFRCTLLRLLLIILKKFLKKKKK